MRRTARQSIKVPSPTIKEKEIGFISHYFTNIGVGILEVTQGKVKQGDRVHIKGETTDFIQKISSMQYEHEQVSQAEAGKSIGIKVSDRVRQHDKVYLVL
jgi:putative protease